MTQLLRHEIAEQVRALPDDVLLALAGTVLRPKRGRPPKGTPDVGRELVALRSAVEAALTRLEAGDGARGEVHRGQHAQLVRELEAAQRWIEGARADVEDWKLRLIAESKRADDAGAALEAMTRLRDVCLEDSRLRAAERCAAVGRAESAEAELAAHRTQYANQAIELEEVTARGAETMAELAELRREAATPMGGVAVLLRGAGHLGLLPQLEEIVGGMGEVPLKVGDAVVYVLDDNPLREDGPTWKGKRGKVEAVPYGDGILVSIPSREPGYSTGMIRTTPRAWEVVADKGAGEDGSSFAAVWKAGARMYRDRWLFALKRASGSAAERMRLVVPTDFDKREKERIRAGVYERDRPVGEEAPDEGYASLDEEEPTDEPAAGEEPAVVAPRAKGPPKRKVGGQPGRVGARSRRKGDLA